MKLGVIARRADGGGPGAGVFAKVACAVAAAVVVLVVTTACAAGRGAPAALRAMSQASPTAVPVVPDTLEMEARGLSSGGMGDEWELKVSGRLVPRTGNLASFPWGGATVVVFLEQAWSWKVDFGQSIAACDLWPKVKTDGARVAWLVATPKQPVANLTVVCPA